MTIRASLPLPSDETYFLTKTSTEAQPISSSSSLLRYTYLSAIEAGFKNRRFPAESIMSVRHIGKSNPNILGSLKAGA